MPSKVPKEIAVIGSGLAGLTAAHLLSIGNNNKVTILERAPAVGMDFASVSVAGVDGKEIRIDSPMRSIHKGYYPSLFKLYEYLGIELGIGGLESAWSLWTGNDNRNSVYFQFYKFHFAKRYLILVDFLLAPIMTFLVVFDYLRFFLHAFYLVHTKGLHLVEGTLGEYFQKYHFSSQFVDRFFVPFLIGAGTCSKETMLNYPAKVILHLIVAFGRGVGFYQVKNGVRYVCSKLLEGVNETVFNCEIRGVWKLQNGKICILDSNKNLRYFDHVIFGTQAQIAMKMIQADPPKDLNSDIVEPSDKIMEALTKFDYVPVRVVVHTDKSIMPEDKATWKGINLTSDGEETMATLWVDYFETSYLYLNPRPVIDSEKIIGEFYFPRSFVNEQTCEGIDLLERAQGINNMFFVGSWVWPGMPLLEGCVASSIRVAERLGSKRPWTPSGKEAAVWTSNNEDISITNRYLMDEISVSDEDSRKGPFQRLLLKIFLLWVYAFLGSAKLLLGSLKSGSRFKLSKKKVQ